jgi:hypothetical protein
MKTIKYKLNEMTEMPFIFKLVPSTFLSRKKFLSSSLTLNNIAKCAAFEKKVGK